MLHDACVHNIFSFQEIIKTANNNSDIENQLLNNYKLDLESQYKLDSESILLEKKISDRNVVKQFPYDFYTFEKLKWDILNRRRFTSSRL